MSEGTGAELSTSRRGEVLARLRGRKAGSDDSLAAALPPLGTTVGGFLLESFLGEGGYGTVYLAHRGGRLYAVKFLYLPHAAQWGRRELEVMLRLEEVGGVGLEGHGFWPDEAPLFQFIAMRYVPGEELYAWAEHHNPNVLEIVDVWLELARELAVVHSAGVVHRDLKGNNVLVRQEDGLPVLVDFGVATYAGAPRVTGLEVPGSREYLSPEAVRFNRESAPGERDQAREGDDLWALGVTIYKLLTGTYPFHGHNAVELEKAILQQASEPPHVRNPRVPREVGEVCLRLLEKAPEARYPDADAVVAALVEVKRGADETWKKPVCAAWGPDAATTRHTGAALSPEARLARLNRLVEYEQRHPRRGRPRPAPTETSVSPSPLVALPPPAGAAVASSARPPEEARASVVSRRAVASGVFALALGVLALLTAGHLGSDPVPAPMPGVAASLPTSPVAFLPWTLGVPLGSGQEMALPWCPLNGGGGAAPVWAPTPAPVASATPTKKDMRVKTPRKALPSQKKQSTVLDATGKACTLIWVAGELACASPATDVRPPPVLRPPSAECPPGAVETMKELGIRIGKDRGAEFTGQGPEWGLGMAILVREGPGTTVRFDETYTKLPDGTTLSGELFFGEERIHGRFTQAHTPEGKSYPVCMVLADRSGDVGLDVNEETKLGEGPGTLRVQSNQRVLPVERFR